MAINYTTLFTQLGKIGKCLNSINGYRGTTNPAIVAEIQAQYTTTDTDLAAGLETANASAQQSYSGLISTMKTMAQNTVIDKVNADNRQPDLQLKTALIELIRQMKVDSKTIQQNTISATTTAGGSNLGNGIVNVSLKNNNALNYQMNYAEDVLVTCTGDAQSGGRTIGNETFSVAGEYSISDPTNFLWPKGSASSITLNAIDAGDNNTNNNLLNNGAFETFTVANTPDNWAVLNGAAGTEILSEASVVYAGAKALSFVSTATNPKIGQLFNDSTGTTAVLTPLTTYSVSCWVKADSVPASGTLTVRLYDVTNSLTMVDDSATYCQSVINLNTLTTSYVNFTTVFRTPRELPASYRIEVLANSIPTSRILYIDHLSMAKMTPLYSNGPMFCIHSGASQFIAGDVLTTAVANNYTSGWNSMSEKLFGLNSLGLIIPSGGSPNISDALLV